MAKQAKNRPDRIPVGDRSRDILTVRNKNPDKEYRWVNDVDGRVQRFVEGGWEPVTDDSVTIGERTVDTSKAPGSVKEKSVGGGKKGVLMAIDKDLYDEDQRNKVKRIEEMETAMKQEVLKDRYGKLPNGQGLEIKQGR